MVARPSASGVPLVISVLKSHLCVQDVSLGSTVVHLHQCVPIVPRAGTTLKPSQLHAKSVLLGITQQVAHVMPVLLTISMHLTMQRRVKRATAESVERVPLLAAGVLLGHMG